MRGIPVNKRLAGFTMFELVITMTIIGVLAAIAIPSFKYVSAANRMAAEANSLLGDMQLARSEAVKEGLPVTICSSNDGLTCLGVAAGATWNSGWIVYLDTNANKSVDAGETPLKIQKAFKGTDTFVASANGFYAVTFNREGFGTSGVNTVVNVVLKSTPVNANWTRCLQVTPVGNLNVYTPQNPGTLLPCT